MYQPSCNVRGDAIMSQETQFLESTVIYRNRPMLKTSGMIILFIILQLDLDILLAVCWHFQHQLIPIVLGARILNPC